MRQKPDEAIVSIGILLPLEHRNLAERNRETECAVRILGRLSDAGITATWFADQPATDNIISKIISKATSQAMSVGHEPALRVVDRQNHDNHRDRLISEIIARKSRAEQAGIAISTLALAEVDQAQQQLLAKYGFKAICSLRESPRNEKNPAERAAMRFGLRRVTADYCLTGGNLVSDLCMSLRIRRAIDRAIRKRSTLHILADVPTLAQSNLDRLGALQSIVRHIARRRADGELQVCTVGQLASRLGPTVATRASESILRAA